MTARIRPQYLDVDMSSIPSRPHTRAEAAAPRGSVPMPPNYLGAAELDDLLQRQFSGETLADDELAAIAATEEHNAACSEAASASEAQEDSDAYARAAAVLPARPAARVQPSAPAEAEEPDPYIGRVPEDRLEAYIEATRDRDPAVRFDDIVKRRKRPDGTDEEYIVTKAVVNQDTAARAYIAIESPVYDRYSNLLYSYSRSTGLWSAHTPKSLAGSVGALLDDMLTDRRGGRCRKITAGAVNSLKNDIASAVASLLEDAYRVDDEDVFASPYTNVVHCANGMLHFNDDGEVELRPFDMEYRSRRRIKLAYDPGARCDEFLNSVVLSAMDEEDADLLQRYAGQCLLSNNPTQTMLILHGTAGGGKGTLVNVIRAILGKKEAVGTLRPEMLGERFEICRFAGKTLLTGNDVQQNFMDGESSNVIKSIIGADGFDAEKKGSMQGVQVEGKFSIICTTNAHLRVRICEDVDAWRRRLAIIEYDKPKPARTIVNYDDVLVGREGPGILAWMVEGARRLLADCRDGRGLVLSERQAARVDSMLMESDSVASCVRDCVAPADNGLGGVAALASVNSSLTMAELYTHYKCVYCADHGWDPKYRNAFMTAAASEISRVHGLVQRHDIKRDGSEHRGFSGVRIVNRSSASN